MSSTTLTVDPNGNGNCFTLWRTEHERDNTPNPTRSSSFGLSCIVPSSCSKPPIIDHLILLSTKNTPWCNCHIFCLHLDVEGDVFVILAIPFDGLPTMWSKEITAGMQHLKRHWEKWTGWCERGVDTSWSVSGYVDTAGSAEVILDHSKCRLPQTKPM